MKDSQKVQLWQERIQVQQDSGLSIRTWCEKNEINQNTFFYWKKRLNSQPDSDVCFAEIPLTQIKDHAEPDYIIFDAPIHIRYKDYEILIGSQASGSRIAAVLQALRQSC